MASTIFQLELSSADAFETLSIRIGPDIPLGLLLCLSLWLFNVPKSDIPMLNSKKWFQLTINSQVSNFILRNTDILREGRAKLGKQLYRIWSGWGHSGPSPEFAYDMRNDHGLDFKIDPKLSLLHIVFRMSTRIFLGIEMCRHKTWTLAVSNYTMQDSRLPTRYANTLTGRGQLCTGLCLHAGISAKSYQLLVAFYKKTFKREGNKIDAATNGECLVFDDAIEWLEKEVPGQGSPTDHNISLAGVAIHTTSDLLIQTTFNTAVHPEIRQPLREEVITVLSAEGIKKTALNSLKLVESVFKKASV